MQKQVKLGLALLASGGDVQKTENRPERSTAEPVFISGERPSAAKLKSNRNSFEIVVLLFSSLSTRGHP